MGSTRATGLGLTLGALCHVAWLHAFIRYDVGFSFDFFTTAAIAVGFLVAAAGYLGHRPHRGLVVTGLVIVGVAHLPNARTLLEGFSLYVFPSITGGMGAVMMALGALLLHRDPEGAASHEIGIRLGAGVLALGTLAWYLISPLEFVNWWMPGIVTGTVGFTLLAGRFTVASPPRAEASGGPAQVAIKDENEGAHA